MRAPIIMTCCIRSTMTIICNDLLLILMTMEGGKVFSLHGLQIVREL
jgi:hypothetical protein